MTVDCAVIVPRATRFGAILSIAGCCVLSVDARQPPQQPIVNHHGQIMTQRRSEVIGTAAHALLDRPFLSFRLTFD